MKTVNGSKKKRMLNTHIWVLAVISFILALIVGEVIVMVFMYFNSVKQITDESLLITMYVIPSIAIVAMCVAIYINHRSLQTSNRLVMAINRVSDGDYNTKISYKRLDSFNTVYEKFNKMTDELNSVKTLREDFIRDFSHELKTPIASINGFANLLLEGNISEEERTQVIKIIADESARLSNLAETILMLSKLESQQFIGEDKLFRLDVQLKDCIILLQNRWEQAGLTIETDLDPVKYSGDEKLLKQVWLNLLSNAIKFTPSGGTVTVKLYTEGSHAIVTVADTGIGIPQESLPKIFDKYYQVRPGKGNGLGLAICKRICSLCGGEISVESDEGKGSVFKVKL